MDRPRYIKRKAGIADYDQVWLCRLCKYRNKQPVPVIMPEFAQLSEECKLCRAVNFVMRHTTRLTPKDAMMDVIDKYISKDSRYRGECLYIKDNFELVLSKAVEIGVITEEFLD